MINLEYIINKLELPDKGKINNKLTYKIIEEQLNLSNSDIKKYRESTISISVIYELNETTTKIREFIDDKEDYSVIYVIHVVLNEKNNEKLISKILNDLFETIIMIIFEYKSEYLLALANKYINKVDNNKLVTDKIIYSDYFIDNTYSNYLDNISFSKLNPKDLRDYYKELSNITSIFDLRGNIEIKNISFDKVLEITNDVNFISKYNDLNLELVRYQNEYKKCKIDSEKIEVHKRIVKLKKDLKELL